MKTISPLQIPATPPLQGPTTSPVQSGPSFKDIAGQLGEQVNTMQLDADHAVQQMFTGGDVNPAEVLTAVQKADLCLPAHDADAKQMMDV